MGIFSFRNKNEKEAEGKKYRFGMEGMLREVLDKNSKGQESLDALSKEIRQIREEYESRRDKGKNYLFDHMDEKLVKDMEEVRLGRKDTIG